MKQTAKNKKIVVIVLALLVVAVSAMALLYFNSRGATQAGEKTLQVTVLNGEETLETYTLQTQEEYLGPALLAENIIEGQEGPYGLYITKAAGLAADESKQEWWCLTQDGEMVNTGVDETPIADQDSFELTLKTGWD